MTRQNKYTEFRDEYSKYHNDGIEYVFGQDQWRDYLKRHNLTEEQAEATLVSDGYGGIGTKEAFKARDEYFDSVAKKISEQCNPDEIFEYEYWNHECGYTGDWSEALRITRAYFPKYVPTRKLLNKLQKEFNECNC